jgi:type I restriction enzyme S subunit
MKLVKIGDLCEVKGGKRLPKGHELLDLKTKHRYIRAREIKGGKILDKQSVYISDNTFNKISRYIVTKGDVVITIVGANVGDTAIIPGHLHNANLTENAVKLCNFKEVDPVYLNYVFQMNGMKDQMQAYASGSAQDKLGIYKVKELKVPFYSNSIQKKIVSILSTYDDLIGNNNQRIELLDGMAEEIYKEWFVRFRYPGYKDSKFFDKDGNKVSYDTSNALPQGWENSQLKNHIEYYRGKSYSSEELRDSQGLAMLNLKNVNRQGGFRLDGVKYFEGKYNTSNEAYAGDIIMAVTDMTQEREIVGRVARVPDMGIDKFIISMDLIRIEPLKLPKVFLYCFFRYSGIGFLLKEFANGANVLHLTPSIIELQKGVIPEIKVCEDFESIISPMLNEIDVLNRKNKILQETRDLLLPRLISGKLNVEDIENINI